MIEWPQFPSSTFHLTVFLICNTIEFQEFQSKFVLLHRLLSLVAVTLPQIFSMWFSKSTSCQDNLEPTKEIIPKHNVFASEPVVLKFWNLHQNYCFRDRFLTNLLSQISPIFWKGNNNIYNHKNVPTLTLKLHWKDCLL